MNWEKWSFFLATASIVASGIISVWAWMLRRHSAGMRELNEVGDRVAELEGQMRHLPNPRALSDLQVGIEGRLSSLEASMKAAQYTLGRIENFMLSRTRDI